MCKPAGLPVRRMPKRPSRSMSIEDRAAEAAGPRPGGIMPYTIALWQTPAARVVLGADVPRSQTHHRRSRAIAWPSRYRRSGLLLEI